MKKFIKPIVIVAAFIACAVMYSCGNKSDMELSLSEDEKAESAAEAESSEGAEPAEDGVIRTQEISDTAADVAQPMSVGQGATGMGMTGTATGETTIFVHVCGAVKKPDVYELNWDARIFEAVKAAGGFTDDADDDYLNLASGITDGQKIYIPTVQEVADGTVPLPIVGTEQTAGTAGQMSAGQMAVGQAAAGMTAEGKVNINTATADELKTLNGIGDKRAQDIIKYRESNGGFKSIEDIKKVDGIKDGIYSKIKDDISV